MVGCFLVKIKSSFERFLKKIIFFLWSSGRFHSCPTLSVYKNQLNHLDGLLFWRGTLLYMLKQCLKFQVHGTSSLSVIMESKLDQASNCIICIMCTFWSKFSNWISQELPVPLIWDLRCPLCIYGTVPSRKMRLLRWLKQFLCMLKNGHISILVYFDATFNLWTWITDERLVRES